MQQAGADADADADVDVDVAALRARARCRRLRVRGAAALTAVVLLAGAGLVARERPATPDFADAPPAAAVVHRYEIAATAELVGAGLDGVGVRIDDSFPTVVGTGSDDTTSLTLVFVADQQITLPRLTVEAAIGGAHGTLLLGSTDRRPGWADGDLVWSKSEPDVGGQRNIVLDRGRVHVEELTLHGGAGPLHLGPGTYELETPIGDGVLRLDLTVSALTAADLGAPSPQAVPATVLDVPEPGEVVPELLANGAPVFVVNHDGTNLSVVSALSTHTQPTGGKLLSWCAAAGGFEDPHHGSRFAADGAYRFGPAPWALVTYQFTLADNGSLRVDAQRAPQPRAAISPAWVTSDPGIGWCHVDEDLTVTEAPVARHGPGHGWPALQLDQARPDGWSVFEGAYVNRGAEPGGLCAALASTAPLRCPAGSAQVRGEPAAGDAGPGDRSAWVGPLLVHTEHGDVTLVAVFPETRAVAGEQDARRFHAGYLVDVDPTGEEDDGYCLDGGCTSATIVVTHQGLYSADGEALHDLHGPPPPGYRTTEPTFDGGNSGVAFFPPNDLEITGGAVLGTGRRLTLAEVAALDLGTTPPMVLVERRGDAVVAVTEIDPPGESTASAG